MAWDRYRPSTSDLGKSSTSAYFDLSPLYGCNFEEQRSMRAFQGGQLKKDCFAEKRAFTAPPGVSCLLVMFNRFHNATARKLLAINEGGRFSASLNEQSSERKVRDAWAKQDNDLFQTARLITCGLYMSIILHDYVRTLIGLNETEMQWSLDPRDNPDTGDPAPASSGTNCSIESNLLNRWHSSLSQRDEKWLEDFFTNEMGYHHDVRMREFLERVYAFEKALPDDPQQREVPGLTRKEDGSFDDEALVNMLADSIEDCAGAQEPNNVPHVSSSSVFYHCHYVTVVDDYLGPSRV